MKTLATPIPNSQTRYELPPNGISLLGYIVRRMHKTVLLLPVSDMVAQGHQDEALAQVALYGVSASVSFGRAYYQPSFNQAGATTSEPDPATGATVTAKLESTSPHYRISYSVEHPEIGACSGVEEISGTTVSWHGLGMPAPSRFTYSTSDSTYNVRMIGLLTSELLPGLFSQSRIRGHGTLDLRDSAGNTGTLKLTRAGEVHVVITTPNGKILVRRERLAAN